MVKVETERLDNITDNVEVAYKTAKDYDLKSLEGIQKLNEDTIRRTIRILFCEEKFMEDTNNFTKSAVNTQLMAILDRLVNRQIILIGQLNPDKNKELMENVASAFNIEE